MTPNNYADWPSHSEPSTVGSIQWQPDDGPGFDLHPDCPGDLDSGYFCAASYLAALECGLEFSEQAHKLALCPAHWQTLLDRAAAEDAIHTLQLASAWADLLYQAVEHQQRRAHLRKWRRP